ncbi:MAG: hypothetical protein CMK07_05750 [Ponticaulis sp.]|nr:hypothetical protein [Ponticaulis sp.]
MSRYLMTAAAVSSVFCLSASADIFNEDCKIDVPVASVSGEETDEMEPVEAWLAGRVLTRSGDRPSLDTFLDDVLACQDALPEQDYAGNLKLKYMIRKSLEPYDPQ